ncbi:MAG: ABC transporter ATP-binding protein [Anaerolineae bacterium]|nr:ABC transporter ATP-binding protein [Anaerolineae bacterium]
MATDTRTTAQTKRTAKTSGSISLATLPLRRPGSTKILLRCLGYLRPYWPHIVGAYVLLLANNGISLYMPQIIRTMVDDGISGGNLSTIQLGTLWLLALTLVRGVCTFLFGRWTEVASQSVAYDMRNALHQKLQSLSFSYHDQSETGQLLARAINDVDRVRFLTGRAVLRLVEITTLIIGIAYTMIAMNLQLALLTLTIVPFLAYGAWDFGRRFRPLSRTVQQKMADLTARVEQNLRGARVVKAFAQEQAEIERFTDENNQVLGINLYSARMRSTYLPLLQLFAGAGTILIILFGGRLVIGDTLTIGELVAFITYAGQLLGPVRRLGWIIAAIAQATASGERVFEILDAQSEVEDLPDAKPLENIQGHVRFKNVSFAYFGRHRVLDDISFEAYPGQIIALLGATGSGKSSIISLIPRFYDATEGQICIDGQHIRHVTLNSLRESIGIVLQDTTLFASTIYENIAFGRPDASRDQVYAAAQAASAHDFIMSLPQQYETEVGERGVTLSGGQKQRVAIARAILKNPRILILDDATSSVDTETEALIQSALAKLMEQRTSFVIAQRLSTVRQADQVLVLDKGRIAARGVRTAEQTAHEQLLRTSEIYADIYHRQLRPQETAAAVLQPV